MESHDVMKNTSVIAIDGPAASGKSTIARVVARRLGRLYVDSGALYRGVTWKLQKANVPPRGAQAVRRVLTEMETKIKFFVRDGSVLFAIDGTEPGEALRSRTVNDDVSYVAAVREVRDRVVGWLRTMTRFGALVMEGRDIGTAVFPDARWKFYLNASPGERARRRHAEIAAGSEKQSFVQVSESLRRRDTIDSGRTIDPLKKAADAVLVDSTSLTADQVAKLILEEVARKV